MRTLGSLRLDTKKNLWLMKLEPHAAMMAKRVFPRLPQMGGTFELPNLEQICFELRWFMERYPLEMNQRQRFGLMNAADRHVERVTFLDQMLDGDYKPKQFKLAVEPREYQKLGAEKWLAGQGLLLADDVGLGKTCTAIAGLTEARPAVVVSLAHLPMQWLRELNKFAPDLFVHILQKSEPYTLPKQDGRGPDVIISSYHKLAGWCDVLAKYCKAVVYDEIQELRHADSQKYRAAKKVSVACKWRIGLSATPIYNYGGEIYNVVDQLFPDRLGSPAEFYREWCDGDSEKAKLADPDAFGSWMKDQHMMLRRTRKDVGRELPPLQRITVKVDSDERALNQISGRAGELARLILAGETGGRGDAMNASGQFDAMLRQATGVAKAPYVATFVEMLLDQKVPVVLFGWHHAVYQIWMDKLRHFAPRLYTGQQTTKQKDEAINAFVKGSDAPGGTDLLILSLRSGAGIDGLQHRCCTTVHGELDWSPGVIEQDIGRVARDGQTSPVVSYMLLAETGSDPLMAEVLGLKQDQVEGLRGRGPVLAQRKLDTTNTLKELARQYLKKRGQIY